MPNSQVTDTELAYLLNKVLPVIKRHKLVSFIVYIFSILYLSVPSFYLPVLEFNSVRISSLMEQRALEHYMFFYPKQSWTSIDDVNPVFLKAVISIEDGEFFRHKGIDWEEFERSLKLNKRRGRAIRGGSTITMQLAKNLFLTTNKNLFRKAKELLITARMEKEVSKRALLEKYVNVIEWGDGVFGIKKAGEEYFDKEPARLNINECVRLAAVIPSPLIHKPNVNSRYVLRRASIIRGRLNDIILFPDL